MPRIKRRQLYVDQKVQGGLMLRAVMYWFFFVISVALMVTCWGIVAGPRQTAASLFAGLWWHYAPALVASVILLPIVLVDCTRFSNRFVGPVFRLRRTLKRMANGEQVEPFQFRKNDFWQEIPNDVNRIIQRLEDATPPVEEAVETVETVEAADANEVDDGSAEPYEEAVLC